MAVVELQTYKKKALTETDKQFIALAKRIRGKDYPQPGEAEGLREWYQGALEGLEMAARSNGESGFDKALDAYKEDNPKLVEWIHLIKDVPPDEEETPKKRTLVNFAELRKRPRPTWVIQDFFYENTIIELYAEAGCYKSFLAFDWAARIATGTDWLGHIKTHKQGKVVYIAAEGADGYILRGDAWCYHNNISFDTLAENFYFWPESLPLTNSAEVTHFINEVTETLSGDDAPCFVVIDTLLRCSNGENINAPDVMSKIFLGAEKIKKETGASNILIVHHSGKDSSKGAMSSIVLKNNCDIIYSMHKDTSTPGQVILMGEKAKDKAEPNIVLRSQKVYYGDMWDEDNASLVLIAGEKAPDDQERAVPDSQRDLLEIIQQSGEIGYQELFSRWNDGHEKGRSESYLNKLLRKLKLDLVIEQTKNKKYRLYVMPEEEQKELLSTTLSEDEEDND